MNFFGKYKKKGKRRNTYAGKGRKAAGRAGVSASVKKYVKRSIAKNTENKCVQINGGVGFGNVGESPDLNAYPMLPITGYWTIPQGLGQGGRIGNEIKIKSVYLNYIITPRPYDATSNIVPQPCEIDLYLGHIRATPNVIPTSTDINALYQNGSSFASPQGSLRDLVSITNKDYWVIKKRWSHKLGYANYGGTGTSVTYQSYANNDFKLNATRKINITKMVPKTLRFNDTTNTTLTKNLFFMYQAVSANGLAMGGTQVLANMEFWIDVVFEDA